MYPRAVELYGHHYKLHRPGDEHETLRGIRRSPLYEALKARGAVYGSRAGWERPNWFAPKGEAAVDQPAFDRAKTNWFPHVGDEHRAIREGVALIDQTCFAKFEITGPHALSALQRLAVSDMNKPVGSTIYTQLCNEKGGIECDLTISRIGPERFYFVTGSAFGTHDRHWIEGHLRRGTEAQIFDVTSARAVINICGPKSRDVLQAVTEEDISNAAFPFSTNRRITVGAAPVLAIRIGYVGELGWELHVPTEYGAHVYEVLRAAGEEYGIKDAGYRAIDSCRMEKNYLYWSSDITPDYTPYEAGLGFRVNLKKNDFIGRQVLAAQKAKGVERKLCTFTLEKPLPVYGGEAVIHGGKVVGVTTSGNYGYTVGKSIAYAYLPVALADAKAFEIESFGEVSPAQRHDGALYDPSNARLKA
jgi:4-methylaminobutanoate oxidase (formaldehyde-forming)